MHVEIVARTHVARGVIIVNGVSFVGLGIVHIHSGHFAVLHRLAISFDLRAGRLLGILRSYRGPRAMGREMAARKDAYKEIVRRTRLPASGGEMNKRAARWT